MTDMTIADRRVADPRHTTAYVASGVLLLLYGIVPLAWTVYALSVRETPIEEFFRALVWPEVDDPVRAMTPYEWALGVAFIVVGAFAVARRRAARGGAIVLAVGLVASSVREAIGLLDSSYRAEYDYLDDTPWLLATRVAALLIGLVVLVSMMRAKDDRNPRLTGRATLPIVGAVILVAAALQLALRISLPGTKDFLRMVVTPADYSPANMFAGVPFYQGFVIVALFVVGIMALRYRRIARGAALAIVPVAGYIGYYSVAPLLPYLSFDAIFSHGLAALTYAASLSTVLAAILVLALLSLRDPDDEPETDDPLDPSALTPPASDFGQQYPGGH
jgi:hypothetical protein